MKKHILFILFLVSITFVGHSQQNVSLGILSDFDEADERNEFINKMILNEIKKVTGSGYNVVLNKENQLSSQWDKEQAISNYQKLSKNCDLIILIGGVSLQGGLNNQPFAVPSIGLGVFNTEIQQIPITKEETSGIDNFSYVLSSQDMSNELMEFKKLVNYENLVFLFDERTNKTIDKNSSRGKLSELSNAIKATIKVVGIDHKNIVKSLEKIPSDTDAVYIAVPYELNENQMKEVLTVVNNKKIPSLSMNQRHVDFGALTSFSKDNGVGYIIRKLAVMADGTLSGEKLEDMYVGINKKQEMFLNISTARKINFSPSFQVLFTANIVNDSSIELPTYTIQDIIKKGLETNLDIQLSNMDISLSENDIKYAKSQFLPDADISFNGTLMDKNRPNPIIGQAEKSFVGNGSVQQLLYSESAIANIKIQKYLKKAQQYATEQEVLTQVLNSFTAYFSVLQAKTSATIQSENLKASKTNLELAKLRSNIGASSNSDVYRWESEVANAKQAVIESQVNVYAAKYGLNTLLNNTLENEFDIEDIQLEDKMFKSFSTSKLSQYVTTPAQSQILTQFLIAEAKKNYPSKKQLVANLDAVERQILMNKRLYYTPTVALSSQLGQNFYRGGLGSEPAPGSEFYDTTWNASLVVSYPLFDGNRRKIDLQKTKIQGEQLATQIENLDQNLALQIRINILNVLTSDTNINFSKIASENTQNNFDLVQQNYKQGTVGITQLIDAQKAALAAKQGYSLSIYNYLLNFLTLENSVGFYSMLNTEKENKAFENRYLDHIKQ